MSAIEYLPLTPELARQLASASEPGLVLPLGAELWAAAAAKGPGLNFAGRATFGMRKGEIIGAGGVIPDLEPRATAWFIIEPLLPARVLVEARRKCAEVIARAHAQGCAGNDSRLSDARTPTSHTHGAADLTDEGDFYAKTRGTGLSDTGGTIAVAYGSTGSTACVGNDARLSDARPPTSHATSHKSAGGDAIKLDELAAPTDVTTLNASTSAHGLMPKGDGNAVHFYSGALTQVAPPYDILCGITGKPSNAEVVLLFVAPRAFRIPANAAGSYLKAGTAATGSSVFSIAKNGSEFLTATVAGSGTTATFASSQTDFAAGDVLKITAPSTADATLADIAITLAATLLR